MTLEIPWMPRFLSYREKIHANWESENKTHTSSQLPVWMSKIQSFRCKLFIGNSEGCIYTVSLICEEHL